MLTNQGINEDPKLGQPEKGPGIVEHMKMEHNMGKKKHSKSNKLVTDAFIWDCCQCPYLTQRRELTHWKCFVSNKRKQCFGGTREGVLIIFRLEVPTAEINVRVDSS